MLRPFLKLLKALSGQLAFGPLSTEYRKPVMVSLEKGDIVAIFNMIRSSVCIAIPLTGRQCSIRMISGWGIHPESFSIAFVEVLRLKSHVKTSVNQQVNTLLGNGLTSTQRHGEPDKAWHTQQQVPGKSKNFVSPTTIKQDRENLFNYKNVKISHSKTNKTKTTLGQALMTMAHPAVWR